MSEKLAAALLQLLEYKDGKFLPIIDRIWAKGKTPAEIIACFECDHYPISVFMGGTNHPTNMQWLTNEEHLHKTQSLDRETHNKVRRAKKKAKLVEPYDPLTKAKADITESCGCVFKDLNTPCRDKDCVVCAPSNRKVELTERQKAYRKAIYEKRKLARKKPHGWGKKKW